MPVAFPWKMRFWKMHLLFCVVAVMLGCAASVDAIAQNDGNGIAQSDGNVIAQSDGNSSPSSDLLAPVQNPQPTDRSPDAVGAESCSLETALENARIASSLTLPTGSSPRGTFVYFLRSLLLRLEQSWTGQGNDNEHLAQPDALPPQTPYQAIDEFYQEKFSLTSNAVLKPGSLPTASVNFKDKDLLSVLVNTRSYFSKYACEDADSLRLGIVGDRGVTLADIVDTLDFAIATLQEDLAQGRPTRLKDTRFLNTHFRIIRWSAYNPQKPQQTSLRITKYAVFTHIGSRTKTNTYNTPIYELSDLVSEDLFYQQYTKQQVLSGIYEPGGREYGKAKPLAYLTRTGLEDALLQGTILINFPDGSSAYFNVDRNNGIAYVKGVAQRAQKRYWYFKQVDAIKGYGYSAEAKISIQPGVTFAGDILNIGLGRLIVLDYTIGGKRQLKLGAIADTGGAFLPNLYQLDLLAGTFPSKAAFTQYIRQLPTYADAYILIKK